MLNFVEPAGPSYGRDMWDNIQAIRESTDSK